MECKSRSLIGRISAAMSGVCIANAPGARLVNGGDVTPSPQGVDLHSDLFDQLAKAT